MDSIQATRLRKGNLVKMNNELYRVLDATHLTPGKGKAFVQSRMRHVKAGTQLDHKFRSVDVVERAVLDDREMQFTYRDGDTFYFMDLETYMTRIDNREPPAKRGDPRRESVDRVSLTGHQMGLIEARMTMMGRDYQDLLTLIHTDDGWKVITKVFAYRAKED